MGKKRTSRATLIQIQPEDLNYIKVQQITISQQEHILNALRLTMVRTIEDRYNVDLAKDSWELDTEKGELRRGTTETGAGQ